MLPNQLKRTLVACAKTDQRITILTGAGISAESGIPTFRGPEGYWTVGSAAYHPQEMATFAMFSRQPEAVWAWYLYRRTVCRQARPNEGHLALVTLEQHIGDRFTLITQNVDGLHLRAGNSLARTYQIHGNVDYMRCAHNCTAEIYPLPASIGPKVKDDSLTETERVHLVCPNCGQLARPHVLWFDEYYNEVYFRFESSLTVAAQTGLLIVIGTSGATNLPHQVARQVYQNGGTIIDINPEANPFSQFAQASGGYHLAYPGSQVLPALVQVLV
jgi:NAD-dependent deacetylase